MSDIEKRSDNLPDPHREEGLTGHDPSAPHEGFLTPATSKDIERGDWEPLASFSAEQTAEFLRGGDIGKPTIDDPDTAVRFERQHQALRLCLFNQVVPALERALTADSADTAARLSDLAFRARNGDPRASQLLGTMIGELLTQGLRP